MEVWKFFGEQPFVTLFLTLGLGHLLGRVKSRDLLDRANRGLLAGRAGARRPRLQPGRRAHRHPGLVADDVSGAVHVCRGPARGAAVRNRAAQPGRAARRDRARDHDCGLRDRPRAAADGWRLPPGYAPGILAGANTISAVMGVASAAVSTGAYAVPAGFTAEQVQANIAAGYSLTYVFSILGIVMLVRNLPAMFGIDPVTAGRESERKFGHDGPRPARHRRCVRRGHAAGGRARAAGGQQHADRPPRQRGVRALRHARPEADALRGGP